MTLAEFNAIRPFLKISGKRIEAARRALVDGTKLSDIGNAIDCTRQAVGASVSAVWRTYLDYQESLKISGVPAVSPPPGWNQGTLIAPDELMARLQRELTEADTKK